MLLSNANIIEDEQYFREQAYNLSDMKVIKQLGGRVENTELIEGVVFPQRSSNVSGPKRIEKAKIGFIQFCISPPKTDIDHNIIVSDYTAMDRILREERAYILNIVKQIKKAGCNVILSSTPKGETKYPPTSELIDCKNTLDILLVMTRTAEGYNEVYREVKKRYNRLLVDVRKEHYKKRIDGSDNKTKCLWQIVSEIKGNPNRKKELKIPGDPNAENSKNVGYSGISTNSRPPRTLVGNHLGESNAAEEDRASVVGVCVRTSLHNAHDRSCLCRYTGRCWW
ncbi:hypothetical protein JTB14_002976 [Gonioctena quinquepunctata]|nr:hypothetical protein JTB14_002976 [Gonioctena quinquepunctata]